MRSEWQIRARRTGRQAMKPTSTRNGQGRLCRPGWQNRSQKTNAANNVDSRECAPFCNLGLSIIVGGTSLQTGRELSPTSQELNELPSVANSRMATSDGRLGLPCCYRIGAQIRLIPVGFLGLMVAIVLWGSAYKFSLYHQHPAPSMRGQVAKLWLENRSSFVVPLRVIKRIPNDRTNLQPFATVRHPAISLVSVPWCPEDFPERQSPTAGFPIPSRSPPSFQLCLD